MSFIISSYVISYVIALFARFLHRSKNCDFFVSNGPSIFRMSDYCKVVCLQCSMANCSIRQLCLFCLFLCQFCSWENPHFSSTVLSELLWQVNYIVAGLQRASAAFETVDGNSKNMGFISVDLSCIK